MIVAAGEKVITDHITASLPESPTVENWSVWDLNIRMDSKTSIKE